MNRPTVAEVLAESLRKAGVETVFGLPGGENVEVLEALRRAGIRFVLVRNENSAVFMAAAAARLSGTPGVCLTTLGPGATNAYAGLAHAFQLGAHLSSADRSEADADLLLRHREVPSVR